MVLNGAQGARWAENRFRVRFECNRLPNQWKMPMLGREGGGVPCCNRCVPASLAHSLVVLLGRTETIAETMTQQLYRTVLYIRPRVATVMSMMPFQPISYQASTTRPIQLRPAGVSAHR
ncbi:uncharacterized protein LAJ45_00482 [Morchella importuna]|uniref:uncharacterized protein n=1 Tax=Morchella importuna TaxID=1174673 RepID=UPI001E8ECB2A|nr:uncharacterized protein LAJ45_00482 [Morchella importuna]KAH8155472.1 hypothetical protein LAJ45_00482 [Morchella importuna]